MRMRWKRGNASQMDILEIVRKLTGGGHCIEVEASGLEVVREIKPKNGGDDSKPSEDELNRYTEDFFASRTKRRSTKKEKNSTSPTEAPPVPAPIPPPNPPKSSVPTEEFDETGPAHQDYDTPLHLDVGLVDDEWVRVPEAGCMQGFCIIGAPGTGKTAGVMYPLLHQLIGHPSRPGGFILEVKGNFSQKLREYCRRYGREQDIIEIRPSGPVSYNPLFQDAPAEFLASRLTEATINLSGGMDPREAFWIQSAEDVSRNIIRLKRMTDRYVTMVDIFRLAADDAMLAEEINNLYMMIESEDVKKEDADGVLMWYQKWSNMEAKMKNSIVGEVTRFTNLFVDSKEFRKTFCPERREVTFAGFEDCMNKGKIVLLDMPPQKYGNPSLSVATLMKLDYFDTVLRRTMAENHERILELYKELVAKKAEAKKNESTHERIKALLGNVEEEFLTGYLKLREMSDRGKIGYAQKLQLSGYWKKILRSVQDWLRFRTARAGTLGVLNKERPVFFICDEYQNFVTAGGFGTMKGDNYYYDRSRESRCVSIVALQDYTSLTQKLRPDIVANILSCLQNKIWLKLDCAHSAAEAARACRISEEEKFRHFDFMALPSFTSIFKGSDGTNVLGPMRMNLQKNFEFDSLIGPVV